MSKMSALKPFNCFVIFMSLILSSCLKKSGNSSSGTGILTGGGTSVSESLNGFPLVGSCLVKSEDQNMICLNIYTNEKMTDEELKNNCSDFFGGIGAGEFTKSVSCASANVIEGSCTATYVDGALQIRSYSPSYTLDLAKQECDSNGAPWTWSEKVAQKSVQQFHGNMSIQNSQQSIRDAEFRN
jgi:hypothetical protein